MSDERIVIHYGPGETSDVPIAELSAATGLGAEQIRASIREAVDAGYLTPRPDGSYDATLPAGDGR